MIATPLARGGGPLFPVACPVCGRRLGSLYRDGCSLRMFATPCDERCQLLYRYGRGRARWRSLSPDLRQVQLTSWMLDHEIANRQARTV